MSRSESDHRERGLRWSPMVYLYFFLLTGQYLPLNCVMCKSDTITKSSISFWLFIKSFLRLFALYLCSCMYRSNHYLAKVKATGTGKLLEACPGSKRWLNCALVNSTWHNAVIRSENYKHHHQIETISYLSLCTCMSWIRQRHRHRSNATCKTCSHVSYRSGIRIYIV
jgi:hypothetical protein